MSKDPFISICIPAYRRVDYLERLLESITAQTYRDFEVVLTDDSPDDSVATLVQRFAGRLPLRYFHHSVPFGTPENWNEGIRLAKGQWIKVMHDDDWFSTAESLDGFAQAVQSDPSADFFFSAYVNVYEGSGERKEVRTKRARLRMLRRNPWVLLGDNMVGNPSCTLFRKEGWALFDREFKWVVDFEFYIRYLRRRPRFSYIDRPLVCVGMNSSQVTNYTFWNVSVQIQENHSMLIKDGVEALRNPVVYDYFWRLYRKFSIRSGEAVREAGYAGPLPGPLASMIRWQARIPRSMLKAGPVSKVLVGLHYLTHLWTPL